MANRNVVVPSYKYYLKKRNQIVLIVLLGLFVLLAIGFTAYFIDSSYQDILQAVTFMCGIVYAVGLVVANQMMFSVSMYTHYYRMIEEDMPPLVAGIHPYLPAFSQELAKQQLILGVDRPLYQVYYRLFTHLPYVKRTGLSIIWLVITKDAIDSYDSRIEDDFIFIKSKLSEVKKIQNEITLVFFDTPTWNEFKKASFQKIVNFHVQNRAMISIPCAVLSTQNKVYALRPQKQFPNKYYYVAIQFLKEITHAG